MLKVNLAELEEYSFTSSKGKFQGRGIEVSLGLGRDPDSLDLRKRHPFDLELTKVPPGKMPYPYHSHSAATELYLIVEGRGQVRDKDGMTPVEAGDAFIFHPGEPHQFINDGDTDLSFYVIADNPEGESGHYPDSEKWLVRSPDRRILRSENLDYFDGEE